jgi:hypothetical protein
MIDYAQVIIDLQTGRKELEKLLTKKQYGKAINEADNLIITLIDLKWWLRKQNDNNK